MGESSKLEQARRLIQEKQYREAEQLLKTIDSPVAEEWLGRIYRKVGYPAQEATAVDSHMVQPTNSFSPRIPKRETEIIVTTADLPYPYDVVAPVYFQVSNKGLFSNALEKLKKKYDYELQDMKKRGLVNKSALDWGFLLYWEYSAGQNNFESAFFVAVRELQVRAALMNAHAVVGMRQDIDLDTNGFQFFYLQMYGTAVRFR
jgi:hypothetical protein